MTDDDRIHARGLIHAARKATKARDWEDGAYRLIDALADALDKRVPTIEPTHDRDYARGIICTARKAMADGDGRYGLLYFLIETLAGALETEIKTSNTLRQTVKSYLATDKFRD